MQLRCCLLFLFLIRCLSLDAQQIDSIKNLVRTNQFDTLQFSYHHELAKLYWETNPDSSILYGHKSIVIAKKIEDELKLGDAVKTLGVSFDYKGNLDSCLNYLNESLIIYKRLNKLDKQSHVLNDIAIAYYFRGNYELALRFHLQALKLRQVFGNQSYISTSYNNLGLVYRSKKEYSKAIYYYKKSLEIKQASNDIQGMVNAYMNIGSAFQNNSMFDSAYYYGYLSLELANKHNLTNDILAAKGNTASALVNLKRTKEALIILKGVEQEALERNERKVLITCYECLGDLYFNELNLNLAQHYLEKGLALARNMNRREALELYTRKLAKVYYAKGEYKQAYEYFVQSKAIADTMFNAENTRQMNELSMVYETAEREKKISTLHIENTLAIAENAKKNQQNIFLTITTILFLGLSILAYFAFVSNKRKKELLNEKNTIIEHALAEKEVLMREIHHRVKNNLQIISSLLSLQTNYIKDEMALEAVNDSRNRVHSMSLIHQSLYSDETVTEIDVQDYISKLLDNLSQSYNTKRNHIQFVKSIQAVKMDVDTIVPIGLILNELVTNSIKYAFDSKTVDAQIEVIFERNLDQIRLSVYDNGIGYEANINNNIQNHFGYKMISAFLKKLHGTMNVVNDSGTKIDIYFKL